MTEPWFEVEQRKSQDIPAVPGSSDHTWQAMFVCQVQIPAFQDWARLKWGFNTAALFDEFLERQRVFWESQHGFRRETGMEAPDLRTLAYRLIHRPGEGLLVAVLGKIHARSEKEVREEALFYYGELQSTFPYDYSLVPAQSQEEFFYLSGKEILDENNSQPCLAQIKRTEFPLNPEHKSPFLQGLWQSGLHAHDPIWRSLAAAAVPLLLNLSLRSTVLYEQERERLIRSSEEYARLHGRGREAKLPAALQKWHNQYIERHLAPWKKFFYLQVHLASPHRISEHLYRTIGTSLTLSRDGEAAPGYKVVFPKSDEGRAWQRRLIHLDPIFSGSYLPVSRLSEVADLDEVCAVMRLPYSPPENGFPDVQFHSTGRT